MSYQQIKWLILLIPTVTIGLWEYVRHEFLLPYISMEMGNWLTPVILFIVTMLLLVKLFRLLEQIQEDLQQQKEAKVALMEREKLARELHDGIAQSLFLLAVKIDKLEQTTEVKKKREYMELRKTMQHVYEDVRHSIQTLKQEPSMVQPPWKQQITELIEQFKREASCQVHVHWDLDEAQLSTKEKVEFYAIMKESLINIQKHAACTIVWITCNSGPTEWSLIIKDNGRGFSEEDLMQDGRHGLSIIQDRAKEMGWLYSFTREGNQTIMQIKKEGSL